MYETKATTPTEEETAAQSVPDNEKSPLRRIKTVHALTPTGEGEIIKIQGWVRTVRQQKTVAFIQVNDGSNLGGIQGVATLSELSPESLSAIEQITTGTAVELHGPLIASSGTGQKVELRISNIVIVGPCPGETYPLAKKRHSLEYLRTIAHLRARTNTQSAVARVRSQLAYAIHEYFQKVCGFVYVHTPLITASDCEGAGELFRVTTLNLDEPQSIQQIENTTQTDYSVDFFGKPAYLTVSGQLNAETYATALGDVYTFGPTFRAENSQTTRHLAEFHMLEPEMAFCNLQGAMDNAEQMLQYVVNHILNSCEEDLQFFNQFYDKELIKRLERLRDTAFVRITYEEAITYLQDEIKKDPTKWQFPIVTFGTDLATEHERWLAETKFQSCVFVYNYPKSIKAFYMRDNDVSTNNNMDPNTEDRQTVAAMDLLVPGIGELIGGSQREERYEKLIEKLQEVQLNVEDYSWYLDLRKYGSVPHAGYGLGFERLVTYVCGLENIRDAIAFPRYPGNAEF